MVFVVGNADGGQSTGNDIAYYDAHARDYAEPTRQIDLSRIHDRFLAHVRPGGLILDVGSGAGRDTLAFLERGFEVEAIEPSSELAAATEEFTGIAPRRIRVQELCEVNKFDGIWACASLIHVPHGELQDAVHRIAIAAKPSAPIYISFKLGVGERTAPDGRTFSDLDEVGLRTLVDQIDCLTIDECWISDGEGIARGRNRWINAILVRV